MTVEEFLAEYNEIKVTKFAKALTSIHDFVKEKMEAGLDTGLEALGDLMARFDNGNSDRSELKTLLIIANSLKRHKKIKELHKKLSNRYLELAM